MADTLEHMRESLRDAADVQAWTRQYPWVTLGAALAAGFVAAATLLPRRRDREEEREPALLERILADEQIAARIKELAEEEEARPAGPSVLGSLGMTLLRTFGPALQSAVASALAAKAAVPDAEEMATAHQQAEREAADDASEL